MKARVKLKKMTITEMKNLKVGDRYVVWWAKDDDPTDVRCDYARQTVDIVEPVNGGIIIATNDGFSWDMSQWCGGNEVETGRGIAKFYKEVK